MYQDKSLSSDFSSSRFFQKLMHKRVISFLESHKILYLFQFGFRAKHSTQTSLINITERIL